MSDNAGAVPRLSVVVPTCHRNDLLAICLEHLEPGRQTLECSNYEVIVTDDGTAGTAEQMIRDRFNWAKWVPGPRRGPAANRNRGAAAALGEWLVFCDDDCLPSDDLLRAYAGAIAESAGCRVLEGKTTVDRPKAHPLEHAPINESGGYLWSCNFAIEKSLFQSLGGFNERFPHAAMEDVELRYRIGRMGLPIRFVPSAAVIHPWRLTDVRSHVRKHTVSQLIYVQLHPEEGHLFTLGRNLKNLARYYQRDFLGEVTKFGWLAIRCQPLRWWELVYRGWALAAGSPGDSGKRRGSMDR